MIDLRALRNARLESSPFSWCSIDGLMSSEALRDLSSTFPTSGFREMARDTGSNKTYRFAKRPLLPLGADRPHGEEELSDAWRELIQELRSPEYRRAIEAVSGRRLDPALMEININRSGPGSFVSAHLDHPQKDVVHLLYFNEVWSPDWGGCLRILREANVDAVAAEIPPLLGRSVLMVRSDQAWHGVLPVTAAAPAPRLSLEVEFWREQPALFKPGLRVEAAPDAHEPGG
ncbi:2OG-Fe(II) oxygenase [Sorangium sp. So ce1182]|uniref:2OG-Fe(II) oxygenase n=1 Tax=Sorangium sp. So ce1182 TaxID=3133334 RepID=UPI003F63F7E7